MYPITDVEVSRYSYRQLTRRIKQLRTGPPSNFSLLAEANRELSQRRTAAHWAARNHYRRGHVRSDTIHVMALLLNNNVRLEWAARRAARAILDNTKDQVRTS